MTSLRNSPVMVAQTTKKFIKMLEVLHRLSSVAFPHSNYRAETGFETSKHISWTTLVLTVSLISQCSKRPCDYKGNPQTKAQKCLWQWLCLAGPSDFTNHPRMLQTSTSMDWEIYGNMPSGNDTCIWLNFSQNIPKPYHLCVSATCWIQNQICKEPLKLGSLLRYDRWLQQNHRAEYKIPMKI